MPSGLEEEMAGKTKIDWDVVRGAWEQNFVSARSFCEHVGIDRTYLIEKIRRGGWKLLPMATISKMRKRLSILERSPDRHRYIERPVELRERIKDREAMMEMYYDTVRIMLAKVRKRS
jgi:hypothetical protein